MQLPLLIKMTLFDIIKIINVKFCYNRSLFNKLANFLKYLSCNFLIWFFNKIYGERYNMDGFNIFKEDEAIKEEKNKVGKFRLMVQDDDFEIFESYIRSGRSVICQPYECEDSMNAVFVLKGKLYHAATNTYISSGDYYTFKNLKETHYLSVEEDSLLLMIRKKGFFIEQVAKASKIAEFMDKIQKKDDYTEEHCNRTGNLAGKIASYLKLPDKAIQNVLYAGKIHDVGKIDVPDEILNKPGKLTKEEFDLIKKHPQRGHDIIVEEIEDAEIANIILQHHEKIDGSGYPFGLKGNEICIEAKIIMVADSFDAMTSERPYRKAMKIDDVIRELRYYSGKWYEKEIVEALIKVI